MKDLYREYFISLGDFVAMTIHMAIFYCKFHREENARLTPVA